MSKWKQDWNTAMEEFEQSSQTALTGMNTQFENTLEIQESARDITKFSDSMSQAVQGSNDLHALSELISTECDCEAAMEIAHISLESIYKRLGISNKILPSLENYKDKVALEFIGKAVSSVWNAIKAAFIKLYNMIKNFFNWLFGFSQSADSSIATEAEKTKNITTNKPTVEVKITPNEQQNESGDPAKPTQAFTQSVKAGKEDANIQAVVQASVLHDPNHAADAAAQQEVQDSVQDVKDKLSGDVVQSTKEDLDKTINSTDRAVVCGDVSYVPIKHMNAGHYITYLAILNAEPKKLSARPKTKKFSINH